MALFRRWLVLAHRYLGIPLSLLFVVWFASGIVMMYAGGMPRLTPELRLARLPALDIGAVHLTPARAADRAGLERAPGRATLLTVMGRPAYRFGPTTVFADDGEQLDDIGLAGARTVASRFLGVPRSQLEHVATITRPDQWTLTAGPMPLDKFRAHDALGTELYVSSQTAEVSMLTTRRSRALAWIGTIPHWLYFSALRLNQRLWYRIVVWTSTLGCVLAGLGLVLAVTQFRWRRPTADSRKSGVRPVPRIPYSGWMRWHYVTGAVFGVFTLTWVFSGLLSMEPYAWTNARGLDVPRDVFTGGPLDLEAFPPMDAEAWRSLTDGRAVKEVELRRIQDAPYYLVHLARPDPEPVEAERLHQPYPITGRAETARLLAAARTLDVRDEPFSVDSLMARLIGAVPDVPVVETTLLTEYDSYYYSRGNQTPLPVLRVKFADPAETWCYIDPALSQLLGTVHRYNRVERWLFNGLHSLDFAFWYNRRPLWDVGMIALSLGGLASSGIGLWVGLRRVRRWIGRLRPSRVAGSIADATRRSRVPER